MVYTHWGRTTCPNTQGTELVYDGRTLGSAWNQAGSSNYLCLHNSLQLLHYIPGSQDARTYLYDTRYQANDHPPAFGHLHNEEVPCAVCFSSGRTATITIPGRTSCPSSWTTEYFGYLMTDRSTSITPVRNARAPICVNHNAQAAGNSINHGGSSIFFMEIRRSGSLDGAEITCVVCTK